MDNAEIKKLVDKIGNIKRVTANLGERSAEFAEFVTDAMTAAGVNELLE